LSFQTVFLRVQILTPLFSLTVQNFVAFFRLLDKEFNKESKVVLKTVIFSLQVGLQAILFLTVLSKFISCSSNFDSAFLPDSTKFCSVFQFIE